MGRAPGQAVPSNPHPADTDLAHFDLALTVCAARYLSALRVGRVDPQHFKFGFDVGPKRYGLAEFLRDQVIESPDVNASGREPRTALRRLWARRDRPCRVREARRPR